MEAKMGKSRFKERLEARKAGMDEELSASDMNVLDQFVFLIDELSRILSEESAALEGGKVQDLQGIFEAKAEVVNMMEVKQSLSETVLVKLPDTSETKKEIKEKIDKLKQAISENEDVLGRVSAATSSVSREIKRIQKRHSLNGIYESSGRQKSDISRRVKRFDEKL